MPSKVGQVRVFVFLFAKPDRDDIDERERRAFRKLAANVGRRAGADIATLVTLKERVEICNGQESIQERRNGGDPQRRVGPLSCRVDRQEDDARIRRSLHRSRPRFDPEAIARIRKSVNVSQSVFALYLNTTTSTIRQWEQGDKRPSGIAARMLQIVEKHGLEVFS